VRDQVGRLGDGVTPPAGPLAPYVMEAA
jgi:hypothetical protein